jgi:hypothetical protein
MDKLRKMQTKKIMDKNLTEDSYSNSSLEMYDERSSTKGPNQTLDESLVPRVLIDK